jgi:hypothetical protein
MEDIFFTSPITSLKQVFWVKQSYLIPRLSKFHETSFIGKRTVYIILGANFRINYPILDVCQYVQVCFLE